MRHPLVQFEQATHWQKVVFAARFDSVHADEIQQGRKVAQNGSRTVLVNADLVKSFFRADCHPYILPPIEYQLFVTLICCHRNFTGLLCSTTRVRASGFPACPGLAIVIETGQAVKWIDLGSDLE
jgi:hypothetical protein